MYRTVLLFCVIAPLHRCIFIFSHKSWCRALSISQRRYESRLLVHLTQTLAPIGPYHPYNLPCFGSQPLLLGDERIPYSSLMVVELYCMRNSTELGRRLWSVSLYWDDMFVYKIYWYYGGCEQRLFCWLFIFQHDIWEYVLLIVYFEVAQFLTRCTQLVG